MGRRTKLSIKPKIIISNEKKIWSREALFIVMLTTPSKMTSAHS